MVAAAPPKQYYVRANGKIRGPYDGARLRSMRERGRVGPRDEISADRRSWVAAGTVPDVFPDGFADAEPDAEAPDWYCMRGGQQQGPMTLAALQALVQSRQFAPHDSVWRLGTPGWVLASQVPEIVFPPTHSWWASLHAWTKVGIIAASVLLATAPVWMTMGYYRHRADVAREQARLNLEQRRWEAEQEQRKADRAVQQQLIEQLAKNQRAASSTPSSGPSDKESLSGYRVGDRVKNHGLLVAWTGMITRIEGDVLYVRVDYADKDLARRVSRGAQEQAFREDEIQKDSGNKSIMQMLDGVGLGF